MNPPITNHPSSFANFQTQSKSFPTQIQKIEPDEDTRLELDEDTRLEVDEDKRLDLIWLRKPEAKDAARWAQKSSWWTLGRRYQDPITWIELCYSDPANGLYRFNQW
nr:hypothetical protein [Tanacetum cinerariifolium]